MTATERPTPSPPPPDLTVDVFITTYNEPEDLVLATAAAAHRIRYPHTTWILDDGDRPPELAHAADELGVRYMTRAASWTNKPPRHAKAGNLNNALLLTEGEYILVLDADQVPIQQSSTALSDTSGTRRWPSSRHRSTS